MSGHNVFNDMGRAVALKEAVAVPSTNVIVDLQGMDFPVVYCPSAANVLLPNREYGAVVRVVAAASITVKNAAGVTIVAMSSGQTGFFTATATAGTWTYSISGSTGSLGVSAANVTVEDLNDYYVGADLGTILDELGTHRQFPEAKYTTVATASPFTAAAGGMSGAAHVFYEVTTDGAVTVTTRTATQLYGDHAYSTGQGAFPSYLLTVSNRGSGTLTITAGDGVTAADTMTLATLTTRTFVMVFTSATALTMYNGSKGTIET